MARDERARTTMYRRASVSDAVGCPEPSPSPLLYCSTQYSRATLTQFRVPQAVHVVSLSAA
jgi:hypothetical protein